MVQDSHSQPVGVVIPFFQTQAGLLAAAVRSVLDQQGVAVTWIVVVDDGSPRPARLELDDFTADEKARLIIIEQANAGVAAARNRALDAMPSEVAFVAFLDSDDVWHPDHLNNAMTAFGLGADFYFSDFARTGGQASRFTRSALDLQRHSKNAQGTDLYEFTGDFLSGLVRTTFAGTSTVVARISICQKARFRADLSAGEDILFWASVTRSGARVFFSTRSEVTYHAGVGLIANAGWGTLRSMRVAFDHWKMLDAVAAFFPADSETRVWVDRARRDHATDFLRILVHRAIRLQSIDGAACFEFARHLSRRALSRPPAV